MSKEEGRMVGREEEERKREKPSRELDGSRATIRMGDFTERSSCWSPRRRHKRGSETDSGQETEKRGIHTQKKTDTEIEKETRYWEWLGRGTTSI